MKDTSYGAFLVLTASFSLKTGITLRDNNDFTVSLSWLLNSLSLKSLSVTRSCADVRSSCSIEEKKTLLNQKSRTILGCNNFFFFKFYGNKRKRSPNPYVSWLQKCCQKLGKKKINYLTKQRIIESHDRILADSRACLPIKFNLWFLEISKAVRYEQLMNT